MSHPLPVLGSPGLLAALLLIGCGGKTGNTASDAGGGEGPDAVGIVDTGAPSDATDDGRFCVNIDPSTYDQSCQHRSDCISIEPGKLCDGWTCECPGGGAISASELSRYEAATSMVHPATDAGPLCQCPAFPGPQCLGGTCTVCAGEPSDPPGCHTTAAGAAPDGGSCMEVDLSTYDQSCQTSGDCYGVTAGVLCPGACTCGGAAVNVAERERYENTIQQIGASSACPCPAPGPVACSAGQCIVCGFGPNQPPGCPDAG